MLIAAQIECLEETDFPSRSWNFLLSSRPVLTGTEGKQLLWEGNWFCSFLLVRRPCEPRSETHETNPVRSHIKGARTVFWCIPTTTIKKPCAYYIQRANDPLQAFGFKMLTQPSGTNHGAICLNGAMLEFFLILQWD